jgi:hypothetical protein
MVAHLAKITGHKFVRINNHGIMSIHFFFLHSILPKRNLTICLKKKFFQ